MKKILKSFSFLVGFLALCGCGKETSGQLIVPKSIILDKSFSERPQAVEAFNPKVDILFVIDNSASMQKTQNSLSVNAFEFADAISKVSILNYHIGVVTTDMSSCDTDCGRLQGQPAYLENTTPDFIKNLSQRMIVGTGGSAIEQMFAPVVMALSPGLENTVNGGFYRQDAFLAVIFITDAAEQSKYTPAEFLRFLTAKKLDVNRVLAYGVIRTLATQKSCFSQEDLTDKLENFLSLVANGDRNQKNILSLCSPNYGIKLAEFAKDIVKRAVGAVKLSRVPDAKTIRVIYGAQVIPNDAVKGWMYEPSTNSVLLGEGIEWQDQGLNTGLEIDFETIDLKK